ncbi:hypothetical protein BASA50_003525 [Batrachochytrium salamandrivorans]|uniref:EF-hand domain-containing protein n=1 Tax=Batrachochytrium salamandrivorans TaxID=1357716 RepID=A0ABQ8FHQ3_9FUNG|nr:hypothetical protein BASA60_010120 [Batrachochytrium salamandrivorans]KAH6571492.1 hypothetical protein BASA62_003814 [Batrachochytrium salamandrivorans]KAH6598485.1 hypothetical protein BASA50_003525 [Batrachochytrium salamandrivorans]KAH6599112.1 hypothetical protein BASA61_002643 [Batrachochytrium salamandrivorans]KAH9266497.1 hypothetical protein BASA84_001106 [Batrachochytrium salamandrivorans]
MLVYGKLSFADAELPTQSHQDRNEKSKDDYQTKLSFFHHYNYSNTTQNMSIPAHSTLPPAASSCREGRTHSMCWPIALANDKNIPNGLLEASLSRSSLSNSGMSSSYGRGAVSTGKHRFGLPKSLSTSRDWGARFTSGHPMNNELGTGTSKSERTLGRSIQNLTVGENSSKLYLPAVSNLSVSQRGTDGLLGKSLRNQSTAGASQDSLKAGTFVQEEPQKKSDFNDLLQDMKKGKYQSQTNTFLSIKDESTAEKKQRMYSEIRKLNLSQEENEYYLEAFCLFDLDGSGTIDINELEQVMKSIGIEPTESDILGMMERAGASATGEITVTEFVQLMATLRTQGEVIKTGMDMIRAFGLIDVDNDGFIISQDLVSAFECIGEKISIEQAVDMIRVIDSDADGQIDFSDFESMLSGKLL